MLWINAVRDDKIMRYEIGKTSDLLAEVLFTLLKNATPTPIL